MLSHVGSPRFHWAHLNRMKAKGMVSHSFKFMLFRNQIGAEMVSVVAKSVVPKIVENVVERRAGTAQVAHQNAAVAQLIVQAKDAKAQTE